jgi:hypothetical protein
MRFAMEMNNSLAGVPPEVHGVADVVALSVPLTVAPLMASVMLRVSGGPEPPVTAAWIWSPARAVTCPV